jgi:hypothetical protein
MGTKFKNIYYVSFRPSQRTVNGKSDRNLVKNDLNGKKSIFHPFIQSNCDELDQKTRLRNKIQYSL